MVSDTPNPDDLHQRLLAGDRGALAELFSQHRQRLWQMVRFRMDHQLAGRVDPDDVLQESYLAAAQRMGSFREESEMSGFLWLRLIVKQTMIDVHRRHIDSQKRDARREVSVCKKFSPGQTTASIASVLLGHLTSPSQAVMRAELSDQLTSAIAEMDPMDQEVLALRHFEELTNQEVADTLGIQPKASSMRYVRAIKRLSEIMSDSPWNAANQ